MNVLSLLIAAVLGTGALACQMTTNTETRTAHADGESPATGLEGRTMIASPCPGPLTEDPCPDQPLSAAFDVLDAQNRVVARFQSDEEGHFQVALRPGAYTIIPDAAAPLFDARSQRQPVTVQTEKMTPVTLRFDSGIR